MPISIDGVSYFRAGEIVDDLGIARQTLWRWRKEGSVPPGYRYRDRLVLFTAAEVGAIREFSNRIEPALQRVTASLSARKMTGTRRGVR